MLEPRVTKAALVTVLLLTLAACGGTGGKDYAARAVEICTESNDRIRALGAPQSYTDTQLYARRAKDAVRDEIDALDDLSPTEEHAGSFARYLGTLEQRRQLMDRLAEAADRNNMRRIQVVGDELDRLGRTARTQATAAGIAACEPR